MKVLHSGEQALFEHKTEILKTGEKCPLHWHSASELIYVEKGSLRLAIRKRTYDVLEGEFAFINSCDYHAYRNGYKSSESVLQVYSFSKAYINTISGLLLGFSYIASNDAIEKLGIRQCINNALCGLETERKTSSQYSDALNASYFIQLILNLQKTYKETEEDKGTTINVEYQRLFNNFMYNYEKSPVSEKTMSKFQLILDYIENNFNDTELTLTRLAEISGLSECYISELFTIIVGIKFKQYLNTLRINYALQLLWMSDIAISAAAYESGFETIRTFNSAFKRLKGVTPTEYINGVRGKSKNGGIVTMIDNLTGESCDVEYFGSCCDILLVDDPEGKRGKVFMISANDDNKCWTSFNVSMLFKAGKRYRVSFDAYQLFDAKGDKCIKNTIGSNLFYPEDGGEATAHCGGVVSCTTGDGWHHLECEMTVSEKYVPGLYDKFSVFGNPANDVSVNFLLDKICCCVID